MQRLRVSFGRGVPARFISHLDVMRCWERVFRRASIPVEYTQGFTPHPKIAVAAPLAVGFTGEAELMDVWLRKWMPPDAFTPSVSPTVLIIMSMASGVIRLKASHLRQSLVP